MTFEQHLRSVSRAASQRHPIFTKSWQVFHDRVLLGRGFRGFILPVFEYCSAVWCSAADAHLKLLNRVVSCISLLTGGVFECDLAHRRSVALLYMLYMIICHQMHSLYGVLPCRMCRCGSHALLWSHIATLSYASHCCRTSQYRRTFIPLPISLWIDLGDLVFDGVRLAGIKSRNNAFSLA